MIKIEVTGNSIGEVADKLLAIGASLHRVTPAKSEEVVLEVAEVAPVDPTPAPKSVPSAETSESPPTTEEPSTTPVDAEEPSTTPATRPEDATTLDGEAGEASDEIALLNFDTDVAPIVLQVVKEKGKPVAQEILSQFGVEKASALDTARWPELVAALKDAL